MGLAGSGCDSVGRAVASDTRGPFIGKLFLELLFTLNCKEKTKNRKRDQDGPFKKLWV